MLSLLMTFPATRFAHIEAQFVQGCSLARVTVRKFGCIFIKAFIILQIH